MHHILIAILVDCLKPLVVLEAGGRHPVGVLGRQVGVTLWGWQHRQREEQSLPQEVAATSLVLTHHQNARYVPPELQPMLFQEPAPKN